MRLNISKLHITKKLYLKSPPSQGFPTPKVFLEAQGDGDPGKLGVIWIKVECFLVDQTRLNIKGGDQSKAVRANKSF